MSENRFEPGPGSDGLATALDHARNRLRETFRAGNHIELTQSWIAVFRYFNTAVHGFTMRERQSLTEFLLTFLSLLTEEDYAIPGDCLAGVAGSNPILSNLVAITPLRTTEPYLRLVEPQRNNLLKVCLLWNARVERGVDARKLFDADPVTASAWYAAYCYSWWGQATPRVAANALASIRNVDARLRYVGELSIEPYFCTSYADPERDRYVKEALNRSIQHMFRSVRITHRPKPKRIAVLSQRWTGTSAVYKILRHYIAALRPDYHLTLVHLSELNRELSVKDQFDRVLHVSMRSGSELDLSQIEENDFELALFPDVGMSVESMLLANLRVAPIQCASYGHSVSTWGACIDYWIGGRDVEPEEHPENNYSERLVLIPGSGGPPVRPNYVRSGRTGARRDERIVVNCPCGAYKLNYDLLQDLKEIARRAGERGRHVHYRFFTSRMAFYVSRLPILIQDLGAHFGETATFEVFDELKYQEYMKRMEEGDLTLDAYPFGGCNSIMDVLWIHQPVATRYGNEWNNRYGMALLRRFGLEEMAVHTRDDYLSLGTRLVCDDAYRRELASRIAAADLENGCWDPTEADAFKRAIDHIIANHERLKGSPSRDPIHIS